MFGRKYMASCTTFLIGRDGRIGVSGAARAAGHASEVLKTKAL